MAIHALAVIKLRFIPHSKSYINEFYHVTVNNHNCIELPSKPMLVFKFWHGKTLEININKYDKYSKKKKKGKTKHCNIVLWYEKKIFVDMHMYEAEVS